MSIDQAFVNASITISKIEREVRKSVGTIEELEQQPWETKIVKLNYLKEMYEQFQNAKQDYQQLKVKQHLHDTKNTAPIDTNILEINTYFKTTFAYLFDQELQKTA